MRPSWQKLVPAQPGLMGTWRFIMLLFLLMYIFEHLITRKFKK